MSLTNSYHSFWRTADFRIAIGILPLKTYMRSGGTRGYCILNVVLVFKTFSSSKRCLCRICLYTQCSIHRVSYHRQELLLDQAKYWVLCNSPLFWQLLLYRSNLLQNHNGRTRMVYIIISTYVPIITYTMIILQLVINLTILECSSFFVLSCIF